MAFHKVHCPRCGRTMYADELAFDFGEILNRALEKAKNRTFGKNEEWYDLTQLNLCLYLTLDDLKMEYGFSQVPDGTYEGNFTFTTSHLAKQLVRLADSTKSNMSIDILASGTDMVEYEKLTKAMAKSSDVDIQRLASKIQELAVRIQRNKDAVIAVFHVKVNMQKDDQGNSFANRLTVKFDDGEINNITNFLCKGEQGNPCGKILYGHAGQYKEIIIGLAGTARVGKTAYLAALLACILREGNGIEKLGHDQRVVTNLAYADKAYEQFKHDLLEPYTNCTKIAKTPYIFDKVGGTEAISLFSLTFSINRKKYIFTFIDMPGEVFDDEDKGADIVSNNRQIIKDASAIWLCIAPAQVVGGAEIATATQVNNDLGKAFANLSKTMAAIGVKIPTATLITCSDQIDKKYDLFHSEFNPFGSSDNPMRYLNEKTNDVNTPWVSESGDLYYSNMLWFIQKSFKYLSSEQAQKLPESIESIFGPFTPFAVASYGREIDNPLEVEEENTVPKPSMIEGPFLWTLAELGIIPAYKEKEIEWEEIIGWGPFKKTVTYREVRNVRLKEEELKELLYYPAGL